MSSGPGYSDAPPDGHLGDLVADLADGRLGDADPGLVLQHLDTCPDCRTELADAVVAAAALRGVVASPRPAPTGLHPGPSGQEAPGPVPGSPGTDRGRRVPALAGALAVALLAVGVLGGIGWSHRTGAGTTVPAATAPVTALFRAGGRTSGAAVITGSGATRRMTIEADAGTPAQGTLVTVWLTAADEPTQRVGTLDSSGHGSFVMSATTAAEYSAVVLTEQPVSATRFDRAAVIATAQLA